MKSWGMVALLCFMTGCAASTASNIESALSSLDAGSYGDAITQLEGLPAGEVAGDLELTLLLSSAYAGRAGVDFLELAKTMLEDNNSESMFDAVHTAFVQTIDENTGLADLRSAITTLDGFTGTATGTAEAERRYRLGLLQAIEAFALPTITAKPTTTAAIDVSLITSKDQVQSDFVSGDNNLTNGGDDGGLASDNQLVTVLRDSYCALKDASAGNGFTLAELQDLTLCQLHNNPSSLRAVDFQSTSITTCGDFNFSCSGSDATDTSL